MVQRHEDGVVITVRLSKTIQFQERVHQIPLSKVRNVLFCPLSWLDMLLQMRESRAISDEDVVFQICQSGLWVPLCKNTVLRVFEEQIRGMGLDSKIYSLHSFRHGGISEAVNWEPNLEIIRLQSDHVSSAIHGYVNLPAVRRFRVTQKMGESFSSFIAR